MAWLNLEDSLKYIKSNKISYLESKAISKKDIDKFSDFPYVLKLSSSIVHKTESKAVYTDIYTKKALKDTFENLQNVLKKENVKGKVIIQKQVKGLELLIGINNDAQFGKVIVFGQGGIYTELLDDTAIRILPITKKEIEEMVYATKVSKFFSARGKNYPVSKLILLLEKVCELAKDKHLQELDLNPVILTEKEIYIVDARVNLK
ncbi:MAG TPA: acetate--CoA ligase family protein [Candidatus Diapherotrites archaeon]|jgi:3-hydroxypropionyl-CoA synthetase (ADP-forming)|nr:acetate--CoA ligase family protein [Candidatus Diapherotrites archaeon]